MAFRQIIDKIRSFALGEMGISIKDYNRMTYGQYLAAAEGHSVKLAKTEELFRSLSWILLNSFADQKKLPNLMQEWWPIITDAPDVRKKRVKKGRRISATKFREFIESMK